MTDKDAELVANMPEVGDQITLDYLGRAAQYTVESVDPTPGVYADDPPIGYTVSLYLSDLAAQHIRHH